MNHRAKSGGIVGIFFRDSNECTQHTINNIKTKITLNYLKYIMSKVMGFFSCELKNEFKTAVVNEPSVF